jgi:general secretion pathway protein D
MFRYLKSALVICVLASCTAMDSEQTGSGASEVEPLKPVTGPPAKLYVDASAELASSATALADATADETQRAAPTIYRGTDTQVRMPSPSEPVKFVGEDVSLNFEQAPLSEVMHAIMGDILQLDYIVDQPVQGEVTLRTRTPIPRSQLLQVLESLLMANNALMVKGDDGRYLITASPRGSRLAPTLSNPKNTDAGFSTIIVPLRYISASNMAEILKPVAEEQSFVLIDNTRNVLMLAGTRDQLDGWLDIVGTFDVDQLKGMSVGMFPLENSNVEDVAKALSALLENGEQSDFVRVVPVKRLNSLLVVTPRSNYLDTLGVWIERLDAQADSRFEKRLYVYPVQNTSASRLSKLLNGIYADEIAASTTIESENGSASVGGISRRAGVAPGLSPEIVGNNSGGSSGLGSTSMTEAFADSPGGVESEYSDDQGESIDSVSLMATSGGGASSLQDVRVVADDENNALMIYSTGKQFDLIKDALEQLDVVATQVIIEASILEVTLTDKLRYGLEWTFNNALGDGYKGKGLLTAIGAAPAAIVPGFSYTVADSAGNINAVLNALSEESLINVISTPSVMVLDNNTAFIHVGDQQPIIDQQTTSDASDTSRITQSVSYKDTGVQLMVTPSVNAGGLVTMDIEQSVTDVGPIDEATGQRAFLERNIKSRVAVRSNQSVVLGGLIRENANEKESGIPVLHKLPWVGPLFGSVGKEDNRTELLVIITPRALFSENELYQVGEEMRARIRHMELIEDAP